MAAKLDAEDWRTLVNSYLDEAFGCGDRAWRLRVEKARRRADGAVRLSPPSSENDAERRARGARDPARALVEINARNASKPALLSSSARIGLDPGQVVVDATGEGLFGDAPNIAARVQSAAEPGSIPTTADRPTADRRVVCGGGPRANTNSKGMSDADDALSRRSRRAAAAEGVAGCAL